MKKIPILLMSACAAAFLAGCGDNNSANGNATGFGGGAPKLDSLTLEQYKILCDEFVKLHLDDSYRSKFVEYGSAENQIRNIVHSDICLVDLWNKASPEEREQIKKIDAAALNQIGSKKGKYTDVLRDHSHERFEGSRLSSYSGYSWWFDKTQQEVK